MTNVKDTIANEVEIRTLKEQLHFSDLKWLVAENKLDQIREVASIIQNVDLDLILMEKKK